MKQFGLALVALALASSVQAKEPVSECSQGTAYRPSGTAVVTFNNSTTTVSTYTSHTDDTSQRFRLVSDVDAHVNIQSKGVGSPVATSSSMRVVANAPEYFCVGSLTNLGVIGGGASGILNVTRMVR